MSGAGATPGPWGRWGDLQCDLCFPLAHKGPVLSEPALSPLGSSCRSAGPSTLIALPPLGRVHRPLSSKDRNRGVHVGPAAALRDGTTAPGGLSAEAEPPVLAGHRQATPSHHRQRRVSRSGGRGPTRPKEFREVKWHMNAREVVGDVAVGFLQQLGPQSESPPRRAAPEGLGAAVASLWTQGPPVATTA